MNERKEFQIGEEDWARLMELCKSARSTPVMLVGTVDLAQLAHENVMACWRELGRKYGFDWDTVEPVDEARRMVSAIAIEKGA